MVLKKIFSTRHRSTSQRNETRNEFPLNIRFHDEKSQLKMKPILSNDEINRRRNSQENSSVDSSNVNQSSTSEKTFSSTSNSSEQQTSATDYENVRSIRRSILIGEKEKTDEEFVLKHREKLLLKLSKTNRQFEDETFPSTSASIFLNGISFSSSTVELLHQDHSLSRSSIVHQSIQWLRPEDIQSSRHHHHSDSWSTFPWTIFRDPQANDVIQGALGDCWFITALSVIAERPEYLMKILVTKEVNPQGIYYVRLCQDGQWKQIVIDDRFPCRSDRKMIFSQSRRKQLWVPLIEKALAKLNGTYESIVAGRCCEGLSIVSGSPCETFYLGSITNPDEKILNSDEIWRKLVESHEKGFLMCSMCANRSISLDKFEESGLSSNHAYSLQDLKEFHQGKYRFVKLRNPWGGNQRWKGDKEHLLKEFHLIDSNERKDKDSKRSDGVFWIPFEYFIQYFESVDICKIRSDWFEVRTQGQFRFQSSFIDAFTFEIKQRTEIDLTLHRIVEQNHRFQRTDLTLSISVVNIEKQSNGNHRIYAIPIQSQRGQHKFISTSSILPPGFYFILPFLFDPLNNLNVNHSFNLSIHSSSPIDVHSCSLPQRIQREYLIKLCLFHGEEISSTNRICRTIDDQIRLYQLKTYWDGFILLVENRNSTKYLHFYFHCSKSQNANLSRKDGQHQTRDVIPPMHRQIILICSRKNSSHSFTLIHDFHWQISTENSFKSSSNQRISHWPPIDSSIDSDDIHLPQQILSLK